MLGGNESYIHSISNFTIGNTISYTVQKYASTTDNLTVKIGNTTIATRSNVTGDDVNSSVRTITFSTAELTKIYNAMPKVTKATFTFTITSYMNGTSIGSTSTTATGTIAESVVPKLDEIALIENTQDIATKFGGAFIKNKSKLDYTFFVTEATGTTISSYVLILDGITYTNAEGTTNLLAKSGSVRYSAYVIDSRGRRSNTISDSIVVLDYNAPQISTFKVVRCDADGNENNKGLYAKYTINASITPLNNKNDKSFMILYNIGDSSDWYVWRIENGSYTLDETSSTIGIGEDSCKFRAIAIDYFNPEENPINKYYDLSSSFLFFETTENLDGIAWGKTADESEVFDIGFEKTYLSNLTYVGGNKRNDTEKNIYFSTTEDAPKQSNCKIYGGSGTSDVGIGLYDMNNARAILRYLTDTNRLNLETEKLTHNQYAVEALMTKVFTSTIGRIHYENGLLIQWGSTSITPVANTPTSVEITFPISYTSTPCIMTSGLTSVPGTMVLGEGHNNDSSTGTTLWVTRTNTTATVVRWLAVGFKEV